jgi:hypothetical protein
MLQLNMNHLWISFFVVKGPGTAMIDIYMVTRACRFSFFFPEFSYRARSHDSPNKGWASDQFVLADPVCLSMNGWGFIQPTTHGHRSLPSI